MHHCSCKGRRIKINKVGKKKTDFKKSCLGMMEVQLVIISYRKQKPNMLTVLVDDGMIVEMKSGWMDVPID